MFVLHFVLSLSCEMWMETYCVVILDIFNIVISHVVVLLSGVILHLSGVSEVISGVSEVLPVPGTASRPVLHACCLTVCVTIV